MEEILEKIKAFKEEKSTLLDRYLEAGTATSGDYYNKIQEIDEKIEKLNRLIPNNGVISNRVLSEKNQSQPLNIIDGSNDSGKMISLFRETVSKLDYKSTTEDFTEIHELKTALYNELFADFIGKTTFDPTATSKYIYVVASKIYLAEVLDESLRSDIQSIRNKKSEAKWYDRSLIAASVSLSLIQSKTFDPNKADILLDIISDFEEGVWQRALTGLVLSLLVNINKWQRFDRLHKRLVKLQEIESVQEALFSIEFILRNNQYKSNFFDERIFTIDYFKDNPLHFFLPFYKENEILNHCFDNSKCEDVSYEMLLDFVSKVPFLDSYKYSLFLGLCNNSTKLVKINDEHRKIFLNLFNASITFYPFHNIVSEYYFFFKFYPAKYADEFITEQTSIYGTKLRDVFFNNFNKLKLSADKNIREKKFSAAITDLEKAAAIYSSEDVQYNLAVCYIEKKKFKKATDLLEKIILNDKNDKNAKWKLSRCYRLLENYNAAKKILEELYLLNSKHLGIIVEIAKLHEDLKEYDDALKYLKEAEIIAPEDSSLLDLIGGVYQSKRDYNTALSYHLRVKSLGPKDKRQNIMNLAHDYEELGEYKLAIEYASKAIEIKKKEPYAWMQRGRIYFVGKIDIEKAGQDLLHSLNLSKVDVTYGNLGHVELVKGNFDLAMKYYKECVLRFRKIEDFIEKYNYDLPYILKYDVSKESYEAIRDEMVEFWKKNDKIISDDEIEIEEDNQ